MSETEQIEIDQSKMNPEFDWNDREAVDRIFKVCGFSKEEMICLKERIILSYNESVARRIKESSRIKERFVFKEKDNELKGDTKVTKKDNEKPFIETYRDDFRYSPYIKAPVVGLYNKIKEKVLNLLGVKSVCSDDCFCGKHQKDMEIILNSKSWKRESKKK